MYLVNFNNVANKWTLLSNTLVNENVNLHIRVYKERIIMITNFDKTLSVTQDPILRPFIILKNVIFMSTRK